MGRARFSVEGEHIQTADPTQYGGHVQEETRHDDGPNTLDKAPDDEVARFRGMGEAAAKRQAYQADFGKALGDEQRGIDMRGQQDAGLRYMRQAAMGNAPSQAAILGNAAAGQSLQQQLGASSGARGMGQAAAQMQAQQGMGAQQLGAVGQYTGLRGNEMAHAQSAFGAGANQMRGGDYTQQGMAQQRAEAQAHSELTQRQLNQGAQMGYEQMGINVQQNDVDSALRNAAVQNQKNADMQASHDARNARNMKVYAAAGNAMGTMVGDPGLGDQTSGSDERMKQSVVPLYEAPGTELSDERTKQAKKPEESKTPPRKPSMTDRAYAGLSSAFDKTREVMSDTLGRAYDFSDERTKQSAHAEGDMGHALAQGFKPFEYEYKPGFQEQEGQSPGEKNVGPMAQNMASNPVTGSAVKKRPDGLLVVDIPKATKVNSAGIGYLAAKMKQHEEEIARLKGGR